MALSLDRLFMPLQEIIFSFGLRYFYLSLTTYRVYNGASSDNLTMHWHGISQYGSPFADGTPYASQWPIPAGKYFDYEFQFEDDLDGTLYTLVQALVNRPVGIIHTSALNLLPVMVHSLSCHGAGTPPIVPVRT
jgi:hypothetical protein